MINVKNKLTNIKSAVTITTSAERISRAKHVLVHRKSDVVVYGTKTYTSFGGVFLILGGVVACISIAFEYGVILQTQADETL